ncbi:MAG: helix-turn-helix domain-containing protein [Candidatus Krumholzibacteriia bacterium]
MNEMSVPFESLDCAYISGLVEGGVDESTTVDYKSELKNLKTDSEKKDYLKDLASFANTQGGIIVWGIREEDGVPKEIVGVEESSIDNAILQMEQLAKTGVEPAIPGVMTKRIPVAGGHCVIQRVPRSLIGPHMVCYGNYDRFFMRMSRSNNPMDYRDIRRAFLASEGRFEALRKARGARITSIAGGDTPVTLDYDNFQVLHVIPLAGGDTNLSVSEFCSKGSLFHALRGEGSGTPTINFDGVVFHDGSYREENTSTYCQVFRSGMIEAVGPIAYYGADRIPSVDVEETSIEGAKAYIAGLMALGVAYPFAIGIALVGVKGYKIFKGTAENYGHFRRFRENVLVVPEIVVEDAGAKIDAVLRPAFDCIWNAGGHSCSPNYDENGNWNGH